jgi:hypothetical protein
MHSNVLARAIYLRIVGATNVAVVRSLWMVPTTSFKWGRRFRARGLRLPPRRIFLLSSASAPHRAGGRTRTF